MGDDVSLTQIPEDTAAQLSIVRLGAMVSARCGDADAARRAREVAQILLDDAIRHSLPSDGSRRDAEGRHRSE
jgi:hypothetical protein